MSVLLKSHLRIRAKAGGIYLPNTDPNIYHHKLCLKDLIIMEIIVIIIVNNNII